jgi:hypothetical protein
VQQSEGVAADAWCVCQNSPPRGVGKIGEGLIPSKVEFVALGFSHTGDEEEVIVEDYLFITRWAPFGAAGWVTLVTPRRGVWVACALLKKVDERSALFLVQPQQWCHIVDAVAPIAQDKADLW